MSENINSTLGAGSRHPKCVCVNNACRAEIEEAAAEFCPICGMAQNAPKNYAPAPQRTGELVANRTITPPTTSSQQQNNGIEFRASEYVWYWDEAEPNEARKPEVRRPVQIIEEKTTLFSHTDRQLTPEQLLVRVRSIIDEKKVPVDAYLYQARWISDWYETRPRIIAFLRNHPYTDLKMILGLDYMGNWANLQYQIGIQPEPYPKPPPSVSSASGTPTILIIGGVIGLFIGFIMAAAGSNTRDGGVVAFGILLLIGGIAAIVGGINLQSQESARISSEQREKERYEREQYKRLIEKANMKLSRTFKIDDKRLFQTAMSQVFKQVVDDIVQSGGQIVKEIKGGRDEFQSDANHSQPAKQSDAASFGV